MPPLLPGAKGLARASARAEFAALLGENWIEGAATSPHRGRDHVNGVRHLADPSRRTSWQYPRYHYIDVARGRPLNVRCERCNARRPRPPPHSLCSTKSRLLPLSSTSPNTKRRARTARVMKRVNKQATWQYTTSLNHELWHHASGWRAPLIDTATSSPETGNGCRSLRFRSFVARD